MKYLTPQLNIMSIAIATVIFFITISTAFAQTKPPARPSVTDIDSTKSEEVNKVKSTTRTRSFLDSDGDKKEYEEKLRYETKTREAQTTDVKPEYRTSSLLDNVKGVFLEKRDIDARVDDNDGDRNERKIQILNGLRDNGDENKDDINREERKEERVDRDKDREEKLRDQKRDRISRFLNNIKRKMDSAVSRLGKLSDRIESRIVKLEERGVDMTDAKRLMDTAKSDMKVAGESINTIIERAKNAFEDNVSKGAFGGIISELSKTKETLKNAHRSLVKVIKIMKASLSNDNPNDDQDNATTTDDGMDADNATTTDETN